MGPGNLVLLLCLCGPGFSLNPTTPKHRFHVPWAVSVMYTNGQKSDFIGAGTIIQTHRVLLSVDNLNKLVPGSNSRVWYYQGLNNLYINAGTNIMDTTTLENHPLPAQTRRVVELYVAAKASPWKIVRNPTDLSKAAGVEYDVHGLAFSVGLVVLRNPFTMSPYVMPMLVQGPGLHPIVDSFVKHMNKSRELRQQTCMTYSWNQQFNSIRYHMVTYQSMTGCRTVFCDWDLDNCTAFPNKGYHLCYKSVWYVDVCPNARGAALYCEGFNKSVLGILTTAPSCGIGHLPGVYTSISSVIDFFENAINAAYPWSQRVQYDLYSLKQNNFD